MVAVVQICSTVVPVSTKLPVLLKLESTWLLTLPVGLPAFLQQAHSTKAQMRQVGQRVYQVFLQTGQFKIILNLTLLWQDI